MATKVVIFGAQGSAREIAWLAANAGMEPVCFVDQEASPRLGTKQNGLRILSAQLAASTFSGAGAILAAGDPSLRRRLEAEARNCGFHFVTLTHPGALLSPFTEIAEGFVCYPLAMIATNVVIGRQVQINVGSTVSHDTILGDYVTLSPGVRLCGYVDVGHSVFLGAGATVVNGTSERRLTIGQGAFIAAGACVTADIAPGARVVGVPARPTVR
jgi:sugar O-acyltransferase (sialic acid O-acetyltransferase NeuD family)